MLGRAAMTIHFAAVQTVRHPVQIGKPGADAVQRFLAAEKILDRADALPTKSSRQERKFARAILKFSKYSLNFIATARPLHLRNRKRARRLPCKPKSSSA